MTQTQPLLKKPIGVYFLALFFLIAPVGNILISFLGSGVDSWYQSNVFFPFLKSIPLIDWFWLSLLFISGLFLFRPHKMTWTLAIISLLIVLGVNIYRMLNVDMNSIDPSFLKVYSIIALFCTLGVLIISFYFRFPYIDRRTKWTSDEQSEERRRSEREAAEARRKS